MAMVLIAVLAIVATSVLSTLGARYQSSYHSSSWQEALLAAESGIDKAMYTLNYSVEDPDGAWASWTPSDATTFPKYYKSRLLELTPNGPSHLGDGNQKLFISTVIDKSLTDDQGRPWYRIRCLGTAELPGTARAGMESSVRNAAGAHNHNNTLRKLTFLPDNDCTGGKLKVPQVSRSIEVIVRDLRTNPFFTAMAVLKSFNMGGGAYADSFDSRDKVKFPGGQYVQANRRWNGHIASNSSGGISDLKGSFVYGNASSNGGTLKGTSNVKGTVANNYSNKFPVVVTPKWGAALASSTVADKPGAPVTLVAGTKAAPTFYKLTTIDLSKDTLPLILDAPAPGQESYINILVTGDIKINGSGIIQQMPGVHVNLYVEGDVTLNGSGVHNKNGTAPYLTLYGVTPTDGSTRDWKITGTANFIGALYAPAYDLKLTGSGDFSGAFVFNSATISGGAGIHFDEALLGSDVDSKNTYVVASWVEDVR